MSLTTESVPRPRVTSSTTPADSSVATRALTTATTTAVRRVRAARDRDRVDVLFDRPDEDPRMTRALEDPTAASAALDAMIRESEASASSDVGASAQDPPSDSAGSTTDAAVRSLPSMALFADRASNRVVDPTTSSVLAGSRPTPSTVPLLTTRGPATDDPDGASARIPSPAASRRPGSTPRDPDPSDETLDLTPSSPVSPPSDGEASWSFLDDSLRTFW